MTIAQNKIKEQITPSHETVKNLVKQTVASYGSELSKDEKIALAKMLMKVFEEGQSPKEAFNMPEHKICAAYSFANSMFTAGRYDHARNLFEILTMFDPYNPDFYIALGASYHRLKDYAEANACYIKGWAFDQTNPLPLFYAYDCFYQLHDLPAAKVTLENTIDACKDPKYAKLKEKAKVLLESLDKEIRAKKVK